RRPIRSSAARSWAISISTSSAGVRRRPSRRLPPQRSTLPLANDEVSVEVESLAPGGDAVGRQQGGEGARAADDGRVTFVPLAAPGERVRARIEREKGKVAWAELVAIERAGQDRVAPPRPAF